MKEEKLQAKKKKTVGNIPNLTKKGNKKKEQRTVGTEQADVRVFLLWPLVKKENLKIFID